MERNSHSGEDPNRNNGGPSTSNQENQCNQSNNDEENSTSYVYRDFSSVRPDILSELIDESPNIHGGAASQKLPSKLSAMMVDPDLEQIISFMPHGRSWRINNREEFINQALPRYFFHSNFNSFIRLVNAWGFRRINMGPDRDSYYHELFLRGMPHLHARMKRMPTNMKKSPVEVEHRCPNFYEMPPLPESSGINTPTNVNNTLDERVPNLPGGGQTNLLAGDNVQPPKNETTPTVGTTLPSTSSFIQNQFVQNMPTSTIVSLLAERNPSVLQSTITHSQQSPATPQVRVQSNDNNQLLHNLNASREPLSLPHFARRANAALPDNSLAQINQLLSNHGTPAGSSLSPTFVITQNVLQNNLLQLQQLRDYSQRQNNQPIQNENALLFQRFLPSLGPETSPVDSELGFMASSPHSSMARSLRIEINNRRVAESELLARARMFQMLAGEQQSIVQGLPSVDILESGQQAAASRIPFPTTGLIGLGENETQGTLLPPSLGGQSPQGLSSVDGRQQSRAAQSEFPTTGFNSLGRNESENARLLRLLEDQSSTQGSILPSCHQLNQHIQSEMALLARLKQLNQARAAISNEPIATDRTRAGMPSTVQSGSLESNDAESLERVRLLQALSGQSRPSSQGGRSHVDTSEDGQQAMTSSASPVESNSQVRSDLIMASRPRFVLISHSNRRLDPLESGNVDGGHEQNETSR